MVAITDKFGKASSSTNYAVATTVKTARTAGVTVLEAFDLSKFAIDAPAFFVTYKKTTDPVTGNVSITNQKSWKALVNPDNNTLTNLTLAPGYTDDGNAVGDFIELMPTSNWANSLVDGILTSLNPDGTMKTSAVNAALGITGTAPADYTALPVIPTVLSIDTSKQVTLRYAGVDLRPTLFNGTKMRMVRTSTPPTRSADFEANLTQYATKASPANITFTTTCAFSAMISPESYAPTQTYVMLARRASGGTAGFEWRLNSSGQLEAVFLNSTGSAVRVWTALRSVSAEGDRATHVAFSVDLSTGTCNMYYDGESVPNTLTNNTGAMTSMTQSITNLELGASQGGGSTWDGRMSEVRVWSTTRTAQQFRDEMGKQLVGNESGLIGYWKLDGNFNDSTANANHFTAMNGAIANYSYSPFSAIEYGKVTSVSYTGGNTDVTVFTGRGYVPLETLAGTSYSNMATPYGFPSEDGWWKLRALFGSFQFTNSPVVTDYQVVGNTQLRLPVGRWRIKAYTFLQVLHAGVAYLNANAALSTVGTSSPTSLIPGSKRQMPTFNSSLTENNAGVYPETTVETFGTSTDIFLTVKPNNSGTTRIAHNVDANQPTFIEAELAYE